ncbi:MAG: protein kinase [Chloroflexaceae bacterium]|nr:protein kinase [Chloroflexaceae bacterium]
MATDRLIGGRLGEYQVMSLLGSGGMAEVYRGYDPALEREVAIKVIHTGSQSPDFIDRFRREARVIASLRHPNVVQVYQFGEQDDFIYMVQELLPGPTLAQRIRRAGKRGTAQSRISSTLEQLSKALDYAHSQGITHRDVKPSNALYNVHDELVLTDFGIARVTTDATQTTTGPGIIMGTPGYIAPEQAISSASITPACDIYALGVVLFELLTGRLPFEGETPMDVVLQHLYDDPPAPRKFRTDMPEAASKVVLRALAKEPEKRYGSAGALVEAFTAAWPLEGATAKRSASSATTVSRPTTNRKPSSQASANKSSGTTRTRKSSTDDLPPTRPQPARPYQKGRGQ